MQLRAVNCFVGNSTHFTHPISHEKESVVISEHVQEPLPTEVTSLQIPGTVNYRCNSFCFLPNRSRDHSCRNRRSECRYSDVHSHGSRRTHHVLHVNLQW